MLKSTESIAALAGALARAQQELTNPDKSLTATLLPAFPGEETRTYRYASLATGLDIVRKSLGRQEIAAIQSTVIDQQSGLVRLLTVLAHSSGEWLSSEWPVCPVAETSNPQRMGAALTYARRYALFTLVGIAGEDDLDAPEPNRPTSPSSSKAALNGTSPARSRLQRDRAPERGNEANRQEPMLPPEDSVKLRDALLAELPHIHTSEGLGRWAHRRLRSKNILQDADAAAVEKAFQLKVDATAAGFEASLYTSETDVTETPNDASAAVEAALLVPNDATNGETPDGKLRDTNGAGLAASGKRIRETEHRTIDSGPAARTGSEDQTIATPSSTARRDDAPRTALPGRTAVDKSVLHLDEPKRIRDKEHLRFVATQPCLLCSAKPSDPHHIRFAQPRALGRKVSDRFVVPLCRRHHDELHDSGNEVAWWHAVGVDPIEIARQLWEEAHRQLPPPSPNGAEIAG